MKKIVFDFQLDGHNLEYLHHLYVGASRDAQTEYIFSVPFEFQDECKVLEWPETSNIRFEYFDVADIWNKKSDFSTALKICVFLRSLVKKHNADELILIWLMNVIPFIYFLMPARVKVSGIIYRLYLYTWKNASLMTKFANCVKYWFITHTKSIKNAYVLNDNSSVSVLNKIWDTNKFKYLADPYVSFEKNDIQNLRNELGIDSSKFILLHPGAMSYRKGTMNILSLIANSSVSDLNQFVFIFAGCISSDIKKEFYEKVQTLKEKATIIVNDSFLPFSYLGSLVYTSDAILLPYNMPDMSSGSIAYASQFSKPVYVYKKGLLGKLVRKYKIGKLVDDFNDITVIDTKYEINSDYCKTHTVDIFNKTILSDN